MLFSGFPKDRQSIPFNGKFSRYEPFSHVRMGENSPFCRGTIAKY